MGKGEIKTAVIPAAGMGRRLYPYTKYCPKCMLKVDSKPILQHTIEALEYSGFEKIIIITGYKSDVIKRFINSIDTTIEIIFVHNNIYDRTNNIYSLFLAFPSIENGFALIESDLIIQPDMYRYFRIPDRIALDNYNPDLHSGTTAQIKYDYLSDLYVYDSPSYQKNLFKTVNIYSFSGSTKILLEKNIIEYVHRNETNIFYEKAISDLVKTDQIDLKMIDFSNSPWHEIDTENDLIQANYKITKQFHKLHEHEIVEIME